MLVWGKQLGHDSLPVQHFHTSEICSKLLANQIVAATYHTETYRVSPDTLLCMILKVIRAGVVWVRLVRLTSLDTHTLPHHTLPIPSPHHTLPPPFPVLHLTSPLHHRAQSGTGKTATFSISMLQKVDIQLREVQTLVLSPTRELAVQIQKVTIPNGMEWKKVKC